MKLEHHIIASTIVGGLFQIIFHRWQLTIAMFLSGIFIDIDHLLDYFIYEKKVRFDIKDFFYKCKITIFKKMYLIFHSYELIAFFVLVLFFTNSYICLGLLIGLGVHLILDLLYNNVHYYGYSFIYRLTQRFECNKVFYE